jgi:hypothetical protein
MAATATRALDVPTGTCAGLSLWALNLVMDATLNPSPARYDPEVMTFVRFVKLPVTLDAMLPRVIMMNLLVGLRGL